MTNNTSLDLLFTSLLITLPVSSNLSSFRINNIFIFIAEFTKEILLQIGRARYQSRNRTKDSTKDRTSRKEETSNSTDTSTCSHFGSSFFKSSLDFLPLSFGLILIISSAFPKEEIVQSIERLTNLSDNSTIILLLGSIALFINNKAFKLTLSSSIITIEHLINSTLNGTFQITLTFLVVIYKVRSPATRILTIFTLGTNNLTLNLITNILSLAHSLIFQLAKSQHFTKGFHSFSKKTVLWSKQIIINSSKGTANKTRELIKLFCNNIHGSLKNRRRIPTIDRTILFSILKSICTK